ncbi:histidinol dehydrogenase, partial [Akkermansiaceae bacterium]|nr:histidinol dehydrogenase [Akkermansiaceae bacterium]
MRVLHYQDADYASFVQTLDRKAIPDKSLSSTVSEIIHSVEQDGDQALIHFTEKFDKITLDKDALFVTDAELAAAEIQVSPEVKEAIEASRQNIHAFANQSL